MPLFLRLSATDWLEEVKDIDSWKVEDSVRLAGIIAERGVDLLDVTSGGLHPKQHIHSGPVGNAYQAVSLSPHTTCSPDQCLIHSQPFAKAIKDNVRDKLLVSAVGSIRSGKQANQLLEEGLDAVMVGRYFQKNPAMVWTMAEELGVEISIANQIAWGVSRSDYLSYR